VQICCTPLHNLVKDMKKISYEIAFSELQSIAQSLQNETISVEELGEKSKRAAALLTFCKTKLRSIETEVNAAFQEVG
jgi:exodeoxyribonuclease VII small subunit